MVNGFWNWYELPENRCRPPQGAAEKNSLRVLVYQYGKITPLMLKLQDENGEIQTIREIAVHSQEKKMYAGIPSIEYDCTLVMGNRQIRAKLVYYQTESQWILIQPAS